MIKRTLARLACLSFLVSTPVLAEDWPSQALKMIVPIAAGSVTDVAARALAQHLGERLAQPVSVINRPGANSVLAAQDCAHSRGDGYTICVVFGDTMSYNTFTPEKLRYNPEKDFKPVTNMYFVTEVLVATQEVPANSVAELHKMATAAPGRFTLATLGPGSTIDTFRKWLGDIWTTEFSPVPYKGSSEIVNALLAGEIDLARIGLGNIAGHFDDRRLKILSVRSQQRLSQLPDVPTDDEVGLGDYPGRPWWGLVVPAATPDEIVERLNREVTSIFRQKDMKDFMQTQFLELSYGTADEFARFMRADRAKAEALARKYPPR